MKTQEKTVTLCRDRRNFLRKMAFGSARLSLGLLGRTACSPGFTESRGHRLNVSPVTGETRVSFATGNDRRKLVYQVLQPFREEMREAIGDRQVVVKLNCVGQKGNPLMVTHPDAVRAVLDFLKPIYPRTVIIGESTIQNRNNVVMGSPLKIPRLNINEKAKMHAGSGTPKFINHNLFLIAHRVRPDFAVLDGFEGVEGNGPANGDPVDHCVALAGPDFLAVDRIGTEIMGIPWEWEDIGYLNFCADAGLGQGDRSKITIIGPDIGSHVRKYRLHDNIAWQLTWKDDLALANEHELKNLRNQQ